MCMARSTTIYYTKTQKIASSKSIVLALKRKHSNIQLLLFQYRYMVILFLFTVHSKNAWLFVVLIYRYFQEHVIAQFRLTIKAINFCIAIYQYGLGLRSKIADGNCLKTSKTCEYFITLSYSYYPCHFWKDSFGFSSHHTGHCGRLRAKQTHYYKSTTHSLG